jgi:hypothetical protein
MDNFWIVSLLYSVRDVMKVRVASKREAEQTELAVQL